MTLEELLAVAEIVEKLTNRYRDQEAAHKAALTEIRASFNARTGADEKIIEGLRIQVQDMRAEMERLREDERKAYQAGVALQAEVAALQERLRASIARGDFAQMEVAALKSQTPKHPVVVGGYLRRLTGFNTTPAGEIARVTLVDVDDPSQPEYEVVRSNGQKGRWSAKGCEPCDPPEATHDTEAGKAVAESAVSAEPVAEEIKVGDVVEVVSNTGLNTWLADVGSFGTVTSIETLEDSLSVRLKDVPDKKNVCGGYVSICDVRKVAALKTEPVAEEIKVGDMAKVVGASGDLTAQSDIGKIGEVLQLDSMDGTVLLSGGAGWVDHRDVRKVTT